MNNAEYWRGRFSLIEDAAQHEADRCISSLEDIYRDAERSVQADLEKWYGRFATNNQISLTEARKMLTTGQLEEFRWTVDQYIKAAQAGNLDSAWIKKLENASAKFHVSRLESIQLQIQQQLEILYGNQVDSVDDLLKRIISNGYTKSAYEIQKGIGLGWDITALDQKHLETLLSKPWTADKKTFRDRCWENQANLVSGIQTRFTQSLLRGDKLTRTRDEISRQFHVSKYKAGRLVHTETTYFNAVAAKETYAELGVDRVEIIETLDSHTCELCQPLDGTIIPMSQYEPGVTVPPFHPNCRGTTAPAIDSAIVGERAARKDDGEPTYYVPSNMTYADWQDAFVNGGNKNNLTPINANATLDVIEQATGVKHGASLAIQDAVSGANPNYAPNSPYSVNCQRCVQAYELRRRGYDVIAKGKPSKNNLVNWGSECFIQPGAYTYSWQAFTLNQTEAAVKKVLANAPDGARYTIYVRWQRKYGGSAHVFIAEKTGGIIHYVDPQVGNMDASDYFSRGSKGKFGYFRMDDKALTTDPNIVSATVEVK